MRLSDAAKTQCISLESQTIAFNSRVNASQSRPRMLEFEVFISISNKRFTDFCVCLRTFLNICMYVLISSPDGMAEQTAHLGRDHMSPYFFCGTHHMLRNAPYKNMVTRSHVTI